MQTHNQDLLAADRQLLNRIKVLKSKRTYKTKFLRRRAHRRFLAERRQYCHFFDPSAPTPALILILTFVLFHKLYS